MKVIWILIVGLLVGCEPSRTNRAEMHARDLQDIHSWHPTRQAEGNPSYDGILGVGTDGIPILIRHLMDDRKTKIMELSDITVPTVGDVCFHLLLRIFRLRAESFRKEGVVIIPDVPNPIFAVRFDPGARKRVQTRFQALYEER